MEVTIEITQHCPHECDYCSSNATHESDNVILSVDKIGKFLNDIKENRLSISGEEVSIHRINISGGEPLSHPNFYFILKLCEQFTNDVRVYTNALKHIIYNTDIHEEIIIEANVCVIGGRAIYVPKNVSCVHFLKVVPQGRAKGLSAPNLKVSGSNCKDCCHKLLQANGKTVDAPCKKDYS